MTHIFNYKSLKNRHENNVHEKVDGFMAGANAKIFIGYIGDREKCVAIKLIKNDEKKNIFENSYLVMNKIQKKLPSRERQHIIELIDYGIAIVKVSKGGHFGDEETTKFFGCFSDDGEENDDEEMEFEFGALITELGTETFGEKIYKDRTDFESNQRSLDNVIRQMVLPLKELHKVAMHLDYKPDNLVYVEMENGGKILKVIDFDGTYLLPDAKDRKGKLPIVSDRLKILTGTERYNAPEFYAELFAKKLSTKTDIWAVGIMLYEILFLQKKYTIYEEMGSDTQSFKNLLHSVNEIHRGFTVSKDLIKYNHHPITYSAEWLSKFNVKILFWMFQAWTDFPRVGLLITNLLSVVPTKRMSAKGIMDFLDGNCCPVEVYEEKLEIEKIFNDLSVKELNKNIDQRVEMDTTEFEEKQKLLALKRMMKKARVKRLEIANVLKLIRTHCDTETTGD
ncbi:hypothetical protein niasHT_018938 [Heterodera trifolii]|uniref:Protein kinase domain-containing protein n=1 Tax=Heterodera trifolii TaxID=157864 RepID=A0ABD2LDV4_9BILA